MNERIDYLELIARLGIDDAHPGGPLASEAMLAALAASGLRPGARILEVGAGGGRSTVRLAVAGYRVTAVERDSRHVARARARLRASGLDADVFAHDAETLPFPEETFDAVWSESVALFVSDRALREWHRVLRPGGFVLARELVLNTPFPPALKEAFIAFYRIARPFCAGDWEQAFRSAGFSRLDVLDRHPLDGRSGRFGPERPPSPRPPDGFFSPDGRLDPEAIAPLNPAFFSGDPRALLPLLQALRTHERLTWTALPHLDAVLFRATKGAPRT
ncbi:MAG: Methyltransferase type 11 [Hydrogenibacillus schlegelii]|uniref:Methyltransferase type 11 n=1 Tax=Hydrogenibacillus schlegelii TaxID=1484 RepID=A0A2T5GEY6_HYDSH|nr:class I SAM-dependent methyltransferase [Hydrogenibacillus schlegelii]PTQ54725.1 MAG: Methyltransferase type 11 [Hydrogenibacillus schlegelii]